MKFISTFYGYFILFIAYLPFFSARAKLLILFMADLLRIKSWRLFYNMSANSIIDEWLEEDRIKNMEKEKRVAVITGASSGLGVEIAKALVKASYNVIILARNEELAKQVVDHIKEESKNTDISFIKCDLASLDSVRQAANQIISKKVKIHLLISKKALLPLDNAGVMEQEFMLSKDGYEMQFATNHLAHFLLTNLLLPRMQENGTIVNTTSYVHFCSKETLLNMFSKIHRL